jgi:hypothetical protein
MGENHGSRWLGAIALSAQYKLLIDGEKAMSYEECPLSLELQLSIATEKVRTLTAQNRKLREQKKALTAQIEALKSSVVVE